MSAWLLVLNSTVPASTFRIGARFACKLHQRTVWLLLSIGMDVKGDDIMDEAAAVVVVTGPCPGPLEGISVVNVDGATR